jgi:hypothetical protein
VDAIVSLAAVVPELRNAAEKLREHMDKIQQEIDHLFTSLNRFILRLRILLS